MSSCVAASNKEQNSLPRTNSPPRSVVEANSLNQLCCVVRCAVPRDAIAGCRCRVASHQLRRMALRGWLGAWGVGSCSSRKRKKRTPFGSCWLLGTASGQAFCGELMWKFFRDCHQPARKKGPVNGELQYHPIPIPLRSFQKENKQRRSSQPNPSSQSPRNSFQRCLSPLPLSPQKPLVVEKSWDQWTCPGRRNSPSQLQERLPTRTQRTGSWRSLAAWRTKKRMGFKSRG